MTANDFKYEKPFRLRNNTAAQLIGDPFIGRDGLRKLAINVGGELYTYPINGRLYGYEASRDLVNIPEPIRFPIQIKETLDGYPYISQTVVDINSAYIKFSGTLLYDPETRKVTLE